MPNLPANALDHRVIFISGSEDALRRVAYEELKSLAMAEDGLDSESCNAGETSPTEWLAAAGTLPFLAEKRTVFVRNLLRIGYPKDVFDGDPSSLAALPPTALLVLVADDEPGDEQKQRDFDKRRDSWEVFLKKAGALVVKCECDAQALAREVKDLVAKEGVTITPRALTTMLEMTGGSYTRAVEEAEKLTMFAGPGGQIQESDVQAVVIPSREWSVYKLVDAIVAGNLGQALEQLRNLIGTSAKAEDAAFRQIFPTLSTQFRRIWQARLCIDAKCPPQNPTPEVRDLFPTKGDLSKEKDWLQRRAMAAARAMSLPRIGQCLQIVADADAALKGLSPSFSGIETLEQTVMKMVAVCKRAA